ncbi:MAG: class I SAM-dependent methyltransferase [Saprospiraceae bacterium]
MGPISFLRESLRDIKTVGTVTRSSKYLCKGVIKPIDFDTARYLVELGAGDGVITEHILAGMHPDAKLLTFEINPKFCKKLRELKDDRLILVEDTAEKLPEYLKENGFEEVDAVISAIPFVSLPKQLADTIVGLCRDAMKIGAPFSQIHYSLIRKKVYEEIFGNVTVDFVPVNIPPAFVLTSRKA